MIYLLNAVFRCVSMYCSRSNTDARISTPLQKELCSFVVLKDTESTLLIIFSVIKGIQDSPNHSDFNFSSWRSSYTFSVCYLWKTRDSLLQGLGEWQFSSDFMDYSRAISDSVNCSILRSCVIYYCRKKVEVDVLILYYCVSRHPLTYHIIA